MAIDIKTKRQIVAYCNKRHHVFSVREYTVGEQMGVEVSIEKPTGEVVERCYRPMRENRWDLYGTDAIKFALRAIQWVPSYE